MKFQRNSLHKPLWATFLMLTIVIFMGISCVSAADLSFDNYKEVSPDATLITYKDSGFGEDTILAEFELNTPHLFQIGLGYQKVLEYK